ncbi:hypothetical protein [Neorhizobium petrolearium]|uniref:HpcH/HpaI aldolase/citrate lyase domain-containing protein n=1 Tax=Neorhizobium petrolearium TaxID=515361 RepID=A0ABY8M738_9HYPH|nr:hypothetical protein [Neorhizobium petrolearium]MCC2610182.1 hypothetical protein [Neorhizobium petrolearium]WGI70345.1 hypothetical protein QEO92_10035 [Neorhizobium petrolearium]
MKKFKIGSSRLLIMKETPKIRSWLIVEPSADMATVHAAGADRLVLDLTGSSESWESVAGSCKAWAELDPDHLPAFLLPPFASMRTEVAAEYAIRAGAVTVLLGGTRNGAEVQRLAVVLRVEELRFGRPPGSTGIVALADSAGILAAASFERCSDRLYGLGWEQDFDPLSDATRLARATIGLAASTIGVMAIDAVSPTRNGPFQSECRIARENGFTGKLSRRLDQIQIINHIFAD